MATNLIFAPKNAIYKGFNQTPGRHYQYQCTAAAQLISPANRNTSVIMVYKIG